MVVAAATRAAGGHSRLVMIPASTFRAVSVWTRARALTSVGSLPFLAIRLAHFLIFGANRSRQRRMRHIPFATLSKITGVWFARSAFITCDDLVDVRVNGREHPYSAAHIAAVSI